MEMTKKGGENETEVLHSHKNKPVLETIRAFETFLS